MKDLTYFAVAIIGSIVAYNVLMWLIVDVEISPVWATIAIVYFVWVYPQYKAMYAMKIFIAVENDEDTYGLRPDKSNWVIFLQDYKLVSYYQDSDSLFKTIVSWALKISTPVMIISLLYTNFLVVFVDLGATVTTYILYAMLGSILVYFVSKVLILMYFINMFNGPLLALIGLAFPLGFLLLTRLITNHFDELQEIRYEESMGENYD